MLALKKLCQVYHRNQKGFHLVEVMVALALLGVIVVAFLGAVSMAYRANSFADERTTAKSLAISQLEYIKNQDYDYDDGTPLHPQYDMISDIPVGYAVGVTAEPLDDPDNGIQRITVTVEHHSEGVISLVGYKVER